MGKCGVVEDTTKLTTTTVIGESVIATLNSTSIHRTTIAMASQVADARAATEHAVQTLSNNLFPAGASSGSGASAAGAAASKSPSPSTTEVSVAMAELNAAVAQQRVRVNDDGADTRPT